MSYLRNVKMAMGARRVVETCADVKPGEQVLIITENKSFTIAESLAQAVCAARGEPTVMIMQPRERDSQEPPPPVAAAMKGCDVFLSAVDRSITHTNAVKEAVAAGSRGLVLTHFSEEMLTRGGIEADFRAIAPVCRAMAAAMAGSKHILLTNPAGTRLEFSAKGRRGNALCGVVGPGEFSTIPTIEANVSPLEGSANGIIVADASIPYIGIGVLRQPVSCEVKDGFITSITGGEQAQVLLADLKAKNDPNVFNVAEMGVGLNPHCRFIGFMLEDEGVSG
jgi:2,5-dihydroxypyridine 5,6-dioxygenase